MYKQSIIVKSIIYKETGFVALLHRRVHLWAQTRFLTPVGARSAKKPGLLLLSIAECICEYKPGF
ncbi:hypothetical protein BI308_25155 [Roseofilum reptotaenium AO1-A]|uniref:Uncharacterized protein n=1 Tax=Roseofilum reptotaenium AO1-A TaxID=1925591 RepID=A0A1L9QJR1_9CYAN|nr:hypothetical protein BI308_25155 [Roseofilum reptotaenium AO1-A]